MVDGDMTPICIFSLQHLHHLDQPAAAVTHLCHQPASGGFPASHYWHYASGSTVHAASADPPPSQLPAGLQCFLTSHHIVFFFFFLESLSDKNVYVNLSELDRTQEEP